MVMLVGVREIISRTIEVGRRRFQSLKMRVLVAREAYSSGLSGGQYFFVHIPYTMQPGIFVF